MTPAPTRTILPATRPLRGVLRALFELYAHDLSPYNGAEVNAQGRFTDAGFLRHWRGETADGIRPFLLQVGGHWAGFAWVGEGSYVAPGVAHRHLVEEFFILRKHRRQGHGAWFAEQLFARFPGEWEIGELPDNVEAQQFWRATIRRLVGAFEEVWVDNERWRGPVQVFRYVPERATHTPSAVLDGDNR